MSQASVGMVIDKLLTDENLRIRFALDRSKRSPSYVCEVSISPATRSSFVPDRCWSLVSEKRRKRRAAAMNRHPDRLFTTSAVHHSPPPPLTIPPLGPRTPSLPS